MENIERLIEICEQVEQDAKKDAETMDGQPFTGKVVATYFGYHGASIAALAEILGKLLKEQNK